MAALLALAAAGVTQAGGIYKWTDAKGNVHYGDSPPPGIASPVAQEVGPQVDRMSDAEKEALGDRFAEACRADPEGRACRQLQREVSREMQKECAPEWRGEPCARVYDDFVRALVDEMAARDPVAASARRAEDEARVAQLVASECAQQRNALVALRRMERGVPGEVMTPEERAGLPEQIRSLEARLARDCR